MLTCVDKTLPKRPGEEGDTDEENDNDDGGGGGKNGVRERIRTECRQASACGIDGKASCSCSLYLRIFLSHDIHDFMDHARQAPRLDDFD